MKTILTMCAALLLFTQSQLFANSTEVNSLQQPPTEEPMLNPEVMPEFPGGDAKLMAWLAKETVYPLEAAEKKIEGRVTASFIIEKDGSLTNIKIISSPHELLSQEVIRLLSGSPKWIPGKDKGISVRTRRLVPVMFQLSSPTAKN